MAPGWHRLSSEAIDEVGYLPFEQDAANLFFQLVSSRYEHASLILTSNLPFARWGDVFGDQTVAADMIDRILHHADVHTLKGSSYRLKHVTDDTLPSSGSAIRQTRSPTRGLIFKEVVSSDGRNTSEIVRLCCRRLVV